MLKIPKDAINVGKDVYLTPEERDYIQMLADGETFKKAAAKTGIHVAIWHNRLYIIKDALGLDTTIQLVVYLVRNKIID